MTNVEDQESLFSEVGHLIFIKSLRRLFKVLISGSQSGDEAVQDTEQSLHT